MVKVLQIGMSNAMGGIERFILYHYQAINRKQYTFDFVSMFGKIAGEEEIEKLGGTIYPVANAKKDPFLCYKQIRELIIQNGYDAVHIHLASFSNPIPTLAVNLSSCKNIILHAHNNGMVSGFARTTRHSISRFATSQMKLERLACSKSAGKWMFGNAPFTVFENSVAREKFYYDEEKRKQVRDYLGIPNQAFVIGTVGRLDFQKNHSFLIQTLSKYFETNPNVYLLIVGDGIFKKRLVELVRMLHLESKVIFTGFQNDVSPYYQAMDLFCLPSLSEGLGIVGIEAQMSGLPCIFSDGCVEEVNISGKSLFVPLEIESWINAIIYYQKQFENWNRNQHPDCYDVEKNVKKLELIYSKGR